MVEWLICCHLLLFFGLSVLFGFNFFVLGGCVLTVLRVDRERTSDISFPSDELRSTNQSLQGQRRPAFQDRVW